MTLNAIPPENLVIYEVKGVPHDPDNASPGPGFLGLWIEEDYTFFFFDQEPDKQAQAYFKNEGNLEIHHIHRMKYEQWQDGAGFSPFTVGPLLIAPAWPEVDPEPGLVMIKIDPGLAFGFGGHPTTRACLEALVRVYAEDCPLSVLDLGTGTGILSLAAAGLGAKRILAVEWSHLAVETARKNLTLNGLANMVQVLQGRAEDHLNFKADLVCANLHYPVQEAIMEKGGFRDRRWLILSGLFHAQAEKLESSVLDLGYLIVDRVRDDRWTTLLFRNTKNVRGLS